MPDALRFERFEGGRGPPSSLLSDRFLLDHEEVEYIVEEHSGRERAPQQPVSAGKTFQLESERGQVTYGFLSLVREDDDAQTWIFYIAKPPDVRPVLPPPVAEVLTDKEPVRNLSEVVEKYPFPGVQ